MAANDSALFTIHEDDLSSKATHALLELHLQQMHLNSPSGSVFALDLSGLKTPEVTVWTARMGDAVLAVGALKKLGSDAGELKAMRTHPGHTRKGAAAAILEHIIAVAKQRGMRRLSLETGSGLAFEAAISLYRKRGFIEGEAFADYQRSGFNQFLHLDLQS